MDQHKQLLRQVSRKSLPYQVIKYILLVLNIMIVTTTAIVTIIICLLPTIIYEKKLSVESALNFLETGDIFLSRQQQGGRVPNEPDLVQLSTREIETIRLVRYVILGLSACIILNQTLAVYGLFRERTCHILISSLFIGLVAQLSLFVLPASVFLLIVLYLTFSIAYVVFLGHLNSRAKQPLPRSASRASSVEPTLSGCSSKGCCCRCKGCLCNVATPISAPMTTTINPSRKTSIPFASQASPSVPYYYGSLGRKSRESRLYMNQLQAMSRATDPANEIYARTGARLNTTNASLKPTNKFTNLTVDNFKNPYAAARRESSGFNYANIERVNNSTMI